MDISEHHSKHVDELKDVEFDYEVTVCDNAHESCPRAALARAKALMEKLKARKVNKL